MRLLWRFLVAFLTISVLSTFMLYEMHVPFGVTNFWVLHGPWFLVAIALFPRLTLVLSGVGTGGVFWWVAWLIAPRFLVAFLATLAYWNTNQVLVTIAWLFALGGESGEKLWISRRRWKGNSRSTKPTPVKSKARIIEAEFEDR